jgi:DNA polymerase III alpha subunit
MPEFTHLHLHTQYSLLDGAIRLDQLFPKVLERGMKSVAMTDHGNLFGALDFYQRAKASSRSSGARRTSPPTGWTRPSAGRIT